MRGCSGRLGQHRSGCLVPSASTPAHPHHRPKETIDVSGYRPVPAQVDLPALEREVLRFWRDNSTFEKSLGKSCGGADGPPRWTFYEGPPTANGRPGTHHVEARVFKDVFP